MPRFFFNLYDDMVSMDDDGRDLSSIEEAVAEAQKCAREMAGAEVVEGHLHLGHRIEVTDAFGELIHTVWFRDVIRVSE